MVRAASTLFIQQDSQYQQSVFESSTVVKVALGIKSPFRAPRSGALRGIPENKPARAIHLLGG
ncbi:hypothetical protein ACFXKS_28590 [Streptomyces scopuliridis]|uniref:hypothetical protein n=1 Tax=Streptomyces scopuliridis TaxID=452529 RepID=UPI0036C0C62A